MARPKPKPMRNGTDDTARAAKVAAVLGAIFAMFAFGLYGGRAALSVMLGAAIGVANLMTMRAIIRALIRGPEDDDDAAGKDDAKAPEASGAETADPEDAKDGPPPDHAAAGLRGGLAWGVFAVLKILVLFGGVWILLTRGLVDPMALVVGYGVLPLGIAVSSLLSNLGTRR